MDFALFMEKYGYKLLIVGVIGGIFLFLFGGMIYSMVLVGYTKSEAGFIVALLVIASLIAAFVGRFMNTATTLLGRVSYHNKAKLLEGEKKLEREREKLKEEGGKLY
jgi:membrane protein DedA with SNARE-associated domain